MRSHAFSRLPRMLLVLVVVVVGAGAQPPGGKPGDAPTLDKTPLPPDAIIVICENLRQAFGQMQPGSVILSPQRYKEMADELARLRKEAQPPSRDRLFAACRLSGAVRTVGGRELAEIKIELEFRTDAPNAKLPLALRGWPLIEAKLDGGVPSWGPAEEGLVLLVPEAKGHLLTATALLPVEAAGLDRKLKLEPLPAAVVTSLRLETTAALASAQAKGHGPLKVATTASGSVIAEEAFGATAGLDLSWRLAAPKTPEAPTLSVIGEQRFFLDAAAAEADVRLRLELTKGRLDELEVRLPGDAQDLRAELLNAAGGRAEPLEPASTGTPERWRLKLKQPLSAGDMPATLRLRWSQSHGGKPGTRIPFSQAEVVRPEKCWQAGTLTVAAPPDLQLRWETGAAVRTEARGEGGEGRGMALAFRYGPRRLELTAVVAAAGITPAAETRWAHEVNLNAKRLRLESELELTRAGGAELEELEVQAPAGWRLDPKLLQNPFVREAEPATPEGLIRLRLASRLPSPLKLRLEWEASAVPPTRMQFHLPRLIAGRTARGRDTQPVRLAPRPGRLQVSGEGVSVRFEVGTHGLFDDEQRPPEFDADQALPSAWLAPPADGDEEPKLALYWRPRLPTARQTGQLRLHPGRYLLEQEWELRWHGPAPTEMRLQGSGGAALPQLWLLGDEASGTPRPLSVKGDGAGSAQEASVKLPRGLTAPARVRLASEGALPAPLTAGPFAPPLWRPNPEAWATLGSSSLELWCARPWEVRGSPGPWHAAPMPDGRTQLRGETLEPPLLRLEAPAAVGPSLVAPRVLVELQPSDEDGWDVRFRAQLASIQAETAAIEIGVPPDKVVVRQVALDGDEVARAALALESGAAGSRLVVPLPCGKLGGAGLLEVRMRLKAPVAAWGGLHWRLPDVHLAPPALAEAVRLRASGMDGRVLLAFAGPAKLEQHGRWGLGWEPPAPALLARPLDAWIAGGASDASERGAYSFAGAPSAVWSAPRTEMALASAVGLFALAAATLLADRRQGALLGAAAIAAAALAWSLIPAGSAAALALGWPGAAAAIALAALNGWRRRAAARLAPAPAFRRAADAPSASTAR